MKHITLAAVLAALAVTATAEINGTYEGALTVAPDAQLRLVIHIEEGQATLDSPDQKAFGIPMSVDYQKGDSIALSVKQISLTYEGRSQGNKIKGFFTQGQLAIPLDMTLSTGRTETPDPKTEKRVRPQDPKDGSAFYTEEEVAIDPLPNVHLAGTLTVPKKYVAGKTPVVLLITGSGQQNRDEELQGHRPFAVIADYLGRNGIASLRYDDRGIGGSTGPLANATTADFTTDAQAWVNLLHHQGFGKVGALGHSEGGRIAFGLKDIDFIVGIGAPALRGDSILITQNEVILKGKGIDTESVDRYCTALGRLYGYVAETGKTPEDAVGFTQMLTEDWPSSQTDLGLAGNLMNLTRTLDTNPWFLYFVQDSPAADIAAFRGDILAFYGEKDCQVIVPENSDSMRRLNPRADVRVMPGLNHLMQPATTGLPDEYETIETTISPEVLEAIATFINN